MLMLLILVANAGAYAQDDVTIYSKKVSAGETPAAIVEAVKKDFPDNTAAVQYYLNSGEMVDTEWGQALEKKIREGNHEYYTVRLKGKKGGFIYCLYDNEGQLKVLKIEGVDLKLPPNIATAATSGDYAGYQITSNKYKCLKVVDKRTEKEYFQVNVVKGKDKKTLFFTPEGEFIKEKNKI